MAAWLLVSSTEGDPEANRIRLDVIRTAGTIVVGTGGAAALMLAARRQRSAEIALQQKDRDQLDVARTHDLQERLATETKAHQERVAAASEADAAARRVTELYTRSAELLGSDKAPLRFAGLYALERLGQDNPGQRQTVVNLVCAYLRLPYAVPGEPSTADAAHGSPLAQHDAVQEREVRLTAQRILAVHLRPGHDAARPAETYWPGTDLDLTGAVLINLDLEHTRIREAKFRGATFVGDATFDAATFLRTAWFGYVTFTGVASFQGTTFAENAGFRRARFEDAAMFYATKFQGNAGFDEAQFADFAVFGYATFTGSAWFQFANFAQDAIFDECKFQDRVPPELSMRLGRTRRQQSEPPGAGR